MCSPTTDTDDSNVCVDYVDYEPRMNKFADILNDEVIHQNACQMTIPLLTTSRKDSRTRGHEVTLVKDQCRFDIRKYSF